MGGGGGEGGGGGHSGGETGGDDGGNSDHEQFSRSERDLTSLSSSSNITDISTLSRPSELGHSGGERESPTHKPPVETLRSGGEGVTHPDLQPSPEKSLKVAGSLQPVSPSLHPPVQDRLVAQDGEELNGAGRLVNPQEEGGRQVEGTSQVGMEGTGLHEGEKGSEVLQDGERSEVKQPPPSQVTPRDAIGRIVKSEMKKILKVESHSCPVVNA